MESEKRRQHDESSRRYLEKVEHAYILDGTSTIYKPKTATAQDDAKQDSPGSHNKRPFWVNVIRDWPVFLVSVGTLILLIATVHYSRKQWQEAQRTATASEEAAHASAEASETAKNSLALSRQEFASSEAAVLQPNVSIRDLGKGPFVQIDIINSGRIAATHVSGDITVSNHQPLQLSNLIVTARSTSPDYPSGFITRTVPLGVTLIHRFSRLNISR